MDRSLTAPVLRKTRQRLQHRRDQLPLTATPSTAPGQLHRQIGFTNTTITPSDTTRAVALNVISFGFFDDFGSFTSAASLARRLQERSTTSDLWNFESDNTNAFAGIQARQWEHWADIGSALRQEFNVSASTAWTAAAGDGRRTLGTLITGVWRYFQFN